MNDVSVLARFEMLRWWRGRRLVAVGVAFVFSALTGPLFAAYTEQILQALQSSDNLTITVEEPTWRSGAVSYLHGAAQIALAFGCFAVASACALGSEPVRIFHRTRSRSAVTLFVPRLLVSAMALVGVAAVGGIFAWYEISLLFDDVAHGRLWAAVAVQAVAIVVVSLVAGLAAIITNSPGPTALVVFFATFVVDVFDTSSGVLAWTPVALLRPYSLLDGDGAGSIVPSLIGSIVLLAVALAVVLSRPLLRPADPPTREMRNHVRV